MLQGKPRPKSMATDMDGHMIPKVTALFQQLDPLADISKKM